jgi:GNAT superfamily N-acetyltransferase
VEVVLAKLDEFRIELKGIEVTAGARRQGIGTRVMNQITELADRTGAAVILFLEPSAAVRLEPFYQRFGFVSMDGGNSMEYEPQSPPQAPGRPSAQ